MAGKTDMKKVFNETLVEIGREDPDVIVINSDSQKVAGTGAFAAQFPQRAYNVGIAEANMVSVAAGFAACGKMPVVNSFTAFMTRRCFDQITISLAYAGLPAILVGTNPGVASEVNGGTHMSFEDVALMRSLPGVAVVEPADAEALRQALRESIQNRRLTYLRLYRGAASDLYGPDYRYEPGKGNVLRDGRDVALVGSGMTVAWCLEAAELLEKKGISASVIDISTIKPLDRNLILKEAAKVKKMITVENGNILGGLGSAVAEAVAESGAVPVKRLGVSDRFGEVGDLEYLKRTFGLDGASICRAAEEFLEQ